MNREVAKIFSTLVLSPKTVRVKLLGDSITNGHSGTGCCQNGDPIVAGYRRNQNGYCYANLLRDYLEANFNCRVINNGCNGVTIRFLIDYFSGLVDEEDDILLINIGTNNRHQNYTTGPKRTRQQHMELVYNDILELYEKCKASGKQFVFIANIPALREGDADGYWRHIHMNDIHDLYVKASCLYGFPLIDLYTGMQEYCEQYGVALDELLADGLHPNDRGYEVMFKLILKEIGIARKIDN